MKKLFIIALCVLPLSIQSMENVLATKDEECKEDKNPLVTLNCQGPKELSFPLNYRSISGDNTRLLPRETAQKTEQEVAALIATIQNQPNVFEKMIKLHAENIYDLREGESEKRKLKVAIKDIKAQL